MTGSEPKTVEILGVSHAYGSHTALRNLSFEVASGEIFGLLGPNGGGKTTLFRILSTIMMPGEGTARICGHDVVQEPAEVRRHIGVVFQSPSLDRKLTVEENLMHQGHLYNLNGAELHIRSDEALRRLGLSERTRQRVETLSGGLQRRVEVAKSLLHRPDLLLLDEPSTGLDPGARLDLWSTLRALRDENGVTSVLTTHLMEEAEQCDRIAILDRGVLVAIGAPAELKNEVGGELVTIQTAEGVQLCDEVAAQFSYATKCIENSVRIELPRDAQTTGPKLLIQLAEAFPGKIVGAYIGKPTLEDVFIHFTGRRFDAETAG